MLFLPNEQFEYKGFITVIKFSPEDNIFYGKIENITDLVLFDGQTVEEAFHYFVESVEDYIDFCKELGKTIDFKESR
jgi:predicted HicB family RNase H-like nuclease